MRRASSSLSFGAGPLSTTLKALIAANVAMFVVTSFAPSLQEYLGLVPALVIHQLWVWQLVTYMFLHGGIFHILFNMLALWMFGGPVENVLGARRFVIFYFACVLGAACAQLAVMYLFQQGQFYPTVGASGGVFGLLLAFAMFYPHARLALMFVPIPVPAPIFVAGYVILELILGVTGTQAGVAHFAHLGGALVGFALIRYWRLRPSAPPY
jgi:membrane associated rhomboid family serine protease